MPKDKDLTISDLQKNVDDWINDIGVSYFSELTQLGQLMEEVGEVSRIVTRTYGDQSFKKGEKKSNLSDELSDVLFTITCLANQTGVDLTRAIRKNLDKKGKRDRFRHHNNRKLKARIKK